MLADDLRANFLTGELTERQRAELAATVVHVRLPISQ
jgi:hypothetical protein